MLGGSCSLGVAAGLGAGGQCSSALHFVTVSLTTIVIVNVKIPGLYSVHTESESPASVRHS